MMLRSLGKLSNCHFFYMDKSEYSSDVEVSWQALKLSLLAWLQLLKLAPPPSCSSWCNLRLYCNVLATFAWRIASSSTLISHTVYTRYSIPGIWQFPYIWHLTISKLFSEQSGFPSRTKLLPFGAELRSWMTRTDWVGSESFLALRILWLFRRCASTPALIWIHLAPNS